MSDEESGDLTNVFTFLTVDEEGEEDEVIDIEDGSEIPEFQAHLSMEAKEDGEGEGEQEDTKDAEEGAFSDIRIAMVGNVDSGKVRFSFPLFLSFALPRSLPPVYAHRRADDVAA